LVGRVPIGDRCELLQRCADWEREVLAAARGDPYVLTENWCSLLAGHWLQVNPLAMSLANDRVTASGVDVFHPVRLLAEHGDEVALALHGGYHDRIRPPAPGGSPADFEHGDGSRPPPKT
jgi:hypothetical protein